MNIKIKNVSESRKSTSFGASWKMYIKLSDNPNGRPLQKFVLQVPRETQLMSACNADDPQQHFLYIATVPQAVGMFVPWKLSKLAQKVVLKSIWLSKQLAHL